MNDREPPLPGSTEWWSRATKEEMWAYIERVDERWAGMGLPRGRRKVPKPSLPKGDAPARREHARTRQVNLKLTEAEHEQLRDAARKYGVRPATMARLLVNRGVRAVLDD